MKRRGTISALAIAVLGGPLVGVTLRAQEPAAAPAPEFYAPEPALRQLVERALEANPGLKEAEARYRASLEQAAQVNALPDPMVTFGQALRSVETRVGPQLNTVMFSQAFPWFGKLDLRDQLAVEAAAAAFETWQARQRDVVAQVKTVFYNLGYVDTAIGVAEEEQSLLEHYEQLAEDRYASGTGLQQAVIRVQAELTKILNRLYMLRQQRETLAAQLNSLADLAPEAPVPPVRSAAPPSVDAASLDLADLYSLGESNRHELKAADARIERSGQSAALAKKNYWPDIVVGAGFVNVGKRGDPAGMAAPPPDNGKNAWTVSVGVSIPLHRDRLGAAVRQADAQKAAEQEGRAKLVNDLEFDVRDQVIRLQTLAEQIRLVEAVLLPQAREAQRSTEAAYQTGQVGVIDLLDSERVLLDVRLMNERQRADYLVALAALERAVGTRFPK